MSRDKGRGFSGGTGTGLMQRGPMSGGEKGPEVAGGSKQKRQSRKITTFDNRDAVFGWGEIIFHPKATAEKSSLHRIPRAMAKPIGQEAGKPVFRSYETRSSRGFKRLGAAVAAVVVLSVVGNNVFGGDDSNTKSETTETTVFGGSTDISTANSGPGIITPGSTVESTPAAGEETTTVVTTIAGAAVINAVAVELLPGDSGPDVVSLQTQLLQIGCDVGPDGADGSFGPATVTGLETFQTNAQLVVDGEYGPASQADLTAALTAGDKTCGVGF